MTVTIHSPFKSPPRISKSKFVDVLQSVGSFDVDALWNPTPRPDRPVEAGRIYDLIISQGHDPSVQLAILGKESSFGTNKNSVLWRSQTRSWTNARTVRHPDLKSTAHAIFDPERKSNYIRYASVYDSVLDGLYRVDEPGFAYRNANAVSIVDHIRIWAPSSDNNQPDGYAHTMTEWINQWAANDAGHKPEEPPVSRKPIIALAAGHHNTNKGGAVGEYERVGPLTREIAAQLRKHGGFDVRVITPGDGMGDFPGGLQDVAREAVHIKADCFLEVHMEGNGAGDAGRGCFAIYPDWAPDVDTDVRDRLGPDMANRVRMLTHLPLRGNGTMSERATGVGSQGFRLGAFSASASARATMTRLLFEYGALTSPRDRTIIDGPNFNIFAAQATVGALAGFYGVTRDDQDQDPRLPTKPHPEARGFPQTGQYVMLGFKAAWERFGDDQTSIEVFGYPLTGELGWTTPSGAPGAVQYFERAVFEYHSDIGKVLLRRLGADALEAQ